MARLFQWFSLKKELTVYFFLSSTLVLFILGLLLYPVITHTINEKVRKDQTLVLENQLQLADTNIRSLENLLIRISTDKNLLDILSRPEDQAMDFDGSARNFYMSLEERLSNLKPYISVLHIQGENGFSVKKGFESYLVSPSDYRQTEWYQESLNSSGEVIWWELQKNFTQIPHVEAASDSQYVIPVFKKICRPDDRETVGSIVLLVTPGFFLGDEYFYEKGTGNAIYIADSSGRIIYTNEENFSGASGGGFHILDELKGIEPEENGGRLLYWKQKPDKLIIAEKSAETGLYLIRVSSWKPIFREESHVLYLAALALVLMMALSVMLSLLLSSRFTKPIEEIVMKINKIAGGDFSYKIQPVTGSGNFKVIYDNLNKMETDIQTMIAEISEKEREKRKLEIEMLQLQINPHFLYNTLNSIKWMAAFQGARGIESMTASLGIVLEAAYSRTDEMISLREELDVLKNYFNIQKIRYQDRLAMEIDLEQEENQNCLIPRFTLQPIVENSIFHGIAPKNTQGYIRITIREQGQDLKITVRDDGVGMNQEAAGEILRQPSRAVSGRGLKGIGMSNVHMRIQLAYGEEYGLTISSKKGEYTEVTVHIRKMYEEGKTDDQGADSR